MITPEPQYSSGSVTSRLEASRRKMQLFLSVEDLPLVARELSRMTKAVGYLRVNYPAAALALGPVTR